MKPSRKVVGWSLTLIAVVISWIVTYQINHLFMAGYNVGSGDYYLLLRDRDVLIDDPKLLQHYKYRITTHKKILRSYFEDLFPIFKTENSDLVLMHKQTGKVKGLRSNQYYWAPESANTRGKRLYRRETWHDEAQFAERLQELKQIPGVTIRYADIPWQFEHVVTIRFPLYLEPDPVDDGFVRVSPQPTLNYLKTRLASELAQHGVNQYRLMAVKHFLVNGSHTYEIDLHPHYGLNPATRVRYKVSGHDGHVFVVRVNCGAHCLQALDTLQPLDWLHSPVGHNELIAQVKATVEAAGKTFDPAYTITNRSWIYTFDEAYTQFEATTEHAHLISGYVRSQPLSEFPVNLELSWAYELGRALNEPYPPELARAGP